MSGTPGLSVAAAHLRQEAEDADGAWNGMWPPPLHDGFGRSAQALITSMSPDVARAVAALLEAIAAWRDDLTEEFTTSTDIYLLQHAHAVAAVVVPEEKAEAAVGVVGCRDLYPNSGPECQVLVKHWHERDEQGRLWIHPGDVPAVVVPTTEEKP